MNARLIIGGLMLAASTTLLAQDSAKPGEGQRKAMREQYMQAREACKGKEGAARGPCIAQHMCAKAPDPAKCQADAKTRMEKRREMREKNSAKGAPKA